MDLVSSLGQMPLDWGKDALVGADCAPDYHQSRWNRTVWVAKPTIRFAQFQAWASGSCSFHVWTESETDELIEQALGEDTNIELSQGEPRCIPLMILDFL
jgi:hypothetical protein